MKADWNYFSFNPPADVLFTGKNLQDNPTEVSIGGGFRSIQVTYSGWIGASPRPVFGFMYDGPDTSEFPLQDGQISAAIRSNNTGADITGVIMRSQLLLNGTIVSASDLNFYMFGVSQDSTVGAPNQTGSIRLYRILNGVVTSLGGAFLAPVVDETADFIQFEIRQVNNGPNVETFLRTNNGVQLSLPGQPGWPSGFALINIDIAPGVLINGGYWGFGALNRSVGTISGNQHFDRISITQELVI